MSLYHFYIIKKNNKNYYHVVNVSKINLFCGFFIRLVKYPKSF